MEFSGGGIGVSDIRGQESEELTAQHRLKVGVAVYNMDGCTHGREANEGAGSFGRVGVIARNVFNVVAMPNQVGIVRVHDKLGMAARR
ncbi:MAG: hypothetical protein OXH09_03805 [Gammaproteobacteria bacterium]|nr:hypothetical protein [Gammaproteobacteria bacterium]